MTPVNTHQTIRLSRGRHRSPEEGACVMELASMLGGERFSDHPTSVCPVVASFLRMYNDAIADTRRQDLYGYASLVVGSRASQEVQLARAAHLTQRTRQLMRARRRWWRLSSLLDDVWSGALATLDTNAAVSQLVRLGDDGHVLALALVDELLAIGCDVPVAAENIDGTAETAATVSA